MEAKSKRLAGFHVSSCDIFIEIWETIAKHGIIKASVMDGCYTVYAYSAKAWWNNKSD